MINRINIMERLKTVGVDFYKCLKYSSLVSSILVIVSGVSSLLISRGNLITTLESIKAVLFVAGSIGLIIGAASILKKDREKEKDWLEWKKRFKIFSYRVTSVIMSIILLLYGCIVDEIIFMLNH
jgi:archaellum biogenesis protein FlaJ (TadC family)